VAKSRTKNSVAINLCTSIGPGEPPPDLYEDLGRGGGEGRRSIETEAGC